MSRVDNYQTENSVEVSNAERKLETATGDIRIDTIAEVKQKVNYLAQLHTPLRQPPELQLTPIGARQADPLYTVLENEINRMSNTETGKFAFAVAELAWRLEGPVTTSDNAGAKEGLAILSRAARMYEHLFILRTEQEES
ncbi:hypothetical protein [uncultured Tateyamaria sp.]|uniref:hypothetical protein n=1 Tax=uncultured Tateyamaria sp. TaxID=455651 RepID=UPI002622603F|nr:hypothetical protein [uncultured Tateyamaria sp.]